MLRSRRKRASATDLYRTCKISNTCPPDVVNKIERNTLADKILKYGSGVVYFGNLGIGTGTGRATTGINIGRGIGSFRPTLPIDTIGPIETPLGPFESTPIDVAVGTDIIMPTDPSVIDPTLIEPPPTRPTPDDLFPRPTDAIEETVPIPTNEVIGSSGDTTAVLDVTPEIQVNNRVSRTQYLNPAFEVQLGSNNTVGETSSTDEVLVAGGGGEFVGERIPLVEFTPRSTPRQVLRPIEEETTFVTSTPEQPIESGPAQPRFYGRRVQQIQVQNPAFITSPGRLVEFDFINPENADEVSLIFQQRLDEVEAAPEPEFQDVVALGRRHLYRGPDGFLRVSRLGQRGTIRTRSGVQIGSDVHFYYELTPIRGQEPVSIPLPGEQSMESSFIQPFSEEGLEIVDLNEPEEPLEDHHLLDTFEETQAIGEDIQLSFSFFNEEDEGIAVSQPVPTPLVRKPGQIYPDIQFKGYTVGYDQSGAGSGGGIIPDDTPPIRIDWSSFDYYLHPSLYKKKRRRRQYVFVY